MFTAMDISSVRNDNAQAGCVMGQWVHAANHQAMWRYLPRGVRMAKQKKFAVIPNFSDPE